MISIRVAQPYTGGALHGIKAEGDNRIGDLTWCARRINAGHIRAGSLDELTCRACRDQLQRRLRTCASTRTGS